MRQFLIAGNWKMNTTISEANDLISKLNDKLSKKIIPSEVKVLVCPPFVNIISVRDAINAVNNKTMLVGAQNCYFEPKGAFTGEVSISMLKEIGCKYVIIGHSERRHIFGESNDLINKKLLALLENDLIPILCIGEVLDERKCGKTYDVLKEQLDNCLKDIKIDDYEKIVIAYEPVWAIGTGISATPKEITEAHNWLRNYFINICGDWTAKQIPLLYGGSLSDTTANETLSITNVDGGLIGGAALVADKFAAIIDTAIKLSNDSLNESPCSCGCC